MGDNTPTRLAVLTVPERLAAALPTNAAALTVEYLPRGRSGLISMFMLDDEAVYGFDETRSIMGRYRATLPFDALADAVAQVSATGQEIVFAHDGQTLILESGGVRVEVAPLSAPAPVSAPEAEPNAAPVAGASLPISRESAALALLNLSGDQLRAIKAHRGAFSAEVIHQIGLDARQIAVLELLGASP